MSPNSKTCLPKDHLVFTTSHLTKSPNRYLHTWGIGIISIQEWSDCFVFPPTVIAYSFRATSATQSGDCFVHLYTQKILLSQALAISQNYRLDHRRKINCIHPIHRKNFTNGSASLNSLLRRNLPCRIYKIGESNRLIMFDKIGSWNLINTVLHLQTSVEELRLCFQLQPSRASHSSRWSFSDIRDKSICVGSAISAKLFDCTLLIRSHFDESRLF